MIAIALLLAPAAEFSRAGGDPLRSPMSQTSLEGCVDRVLKKSGAVAALMVGDGVELRLDRHGAEALAIRIDDRGDRRELSALYRAPVSEQTARQYLHEVARRCLRGDLPG